MPAADCQGCEAKAWCTRSQQGGRQVRFATREVQETLAQRRSEQTTVPFQQVYAPRAGIESSRSEGVRAHGLRQSRYRGLQKTQVQMTGIAAAINLIRLDAMLERQRRGLPPRRARPLSPLARLQHPKVA